MISLLSVEIIAAPHLLSQKGRPLCGRHIEKQKIFRRQALILGRRSRTPRRAADYWFYGESLPLGPAYVSKPFAASTDRTDRADLMEVEKAGCVADAGPCVPLDGASASTARRDASLLDLPEEVSQPDPHCPLLLVQHATASATMLFRWALGFGDDRVITAD